jgi:chemotaxis protein methyltransferase CheR
VRRRFGDLGLASFAAYRAYLEEHPDEWAMFDALTPVTISRFYRDREVMAALQDVVLPELAGEELSVWSAGCASGEEPYTLALMCAFADARVRVLATDVSPVMLRRARSAVYGASSLADLPEEWRARGFEGGRLRDEFRAAVRFRRHDLRGDEWPPGPFDLVLCRNVAFTYFAEEVQEAVVARFARVLRPEGALVVGLHETVPGSDFVAWPGLRAVWRSPGSR